MTDNLVLLTFLAAAILFVAVAAAVAALTAWALWLFYDEAPDTPEREAAFRDLWNLKKDKEYFELCDQCIEFPKEQTDD